MDTLTLYSYDPHTGEFSGAFQADRDPEGDGFLIPWATTEIAPPEPRGGQARVFVNGEWTFAPDFRGAFWFQPDGLSVKVDKLGDPSTFDPPLTKERPVFPEPPPGPATECTPAQGQMALYQAGHYDAFVSAVTNSTDVPLKIYAQSALKWEIMNPHIQSMKTTLGLSDDEVQALFDLAVTL
jgi:hypothetical protein